MIPVTPSQIQTLSQAYKEGKLSYKPNDEINSKVSLWQGDVTKLAVDGIQNDAKPDSRDGSGIDGAIRRAAGEQLYDSVSKLSGWATGNTKLTSGFRLPAKYVLHTIGPVYDAARKSECESQLESCYKTTLQVAVMNGLKSVALCGVSTPEFPLPVAAKIALRTVREFLEEHASELDCVIFCNAAPEDMEPYEESVSKYFPPAE